MSSSVAAAPSLTITSVTSAPSTSHVTSLPAGTTLSTVTVKQERHDEAEIQELAAKMLEAQKAAMAKQAQQQQQQMINRQSAPGQNIPPGVGGQANILNYLTRQVKPTGPAGAGGAAGTSGTAGAGSTAAGGAAATNGQVQPSTNGKTSNSPDNIQGDKKTCDEESQKGHFGWATFGKIYIPYIARQSEKYCAVRMVEMKLLNKYLSYLHPDIYSSCTCVRSYYITEAEIRLLNEINHKHCDAQFGRELFTTKDLVVRLSDATKFFQFLDICYRKLLTGSKSPSDKCGFIRINKESVVPYTVRNGEQVVPLFYFEGETENLRQKADYLSGWDLAYLKFCCKVQGIRNELFSSESVAVISLTDIKSYFPTGTEFEDYWPSKVVDSNLLIATKHPGNSAHWTRQPSAPPPKVFNATQNAPKQGQQQVRKPSYPTGVQNPNNGPRMHSNPVVAASQSGIIQALTNSWSLQTQAPPPILGHPQSEQIFRAAAQALNQQNNRSYVNRGQMPNMIAAGRQQYNYNNGGMTMSSMNCTQPQQPPPLVRSASQNQSHMLNCASSLPNVQRSNSCDPTTLSINQMPAQTQLSCPATQKLNQILTSALNNNDGFCKNNNLASPPLFPFNQHPAGHDPAGSFQSQQPLRKPGLPSLIPMPACKNNISISRGTGVSSFLDVNRAMSRAISEAQGKGKFDDQIQAVVRKVLANPALSAYVTSALSPKQSQSPQIPQNVSFPTPTSPIMRQTSVICSTSTVPPKINHATRASTTPTPSTTMEVIDLSSPRRSTVAAANAALHQQQQQQQQQQQIMSAATNSMQNGRSSQGNNSANSAAAAATAIMQMQRNAGAVTQQTLDGQRLCVIPEITTGSGHIPPYKVQKVYVLENTMLPCINMRAYNDTDQLMTLTDFREFFFPNIPLDHCKRLIDALGVEMYKGNRRQTQTLIESGKPHSENIPLVRVRDVIKYMPQLRYMMRSQEQPPNKRTRIS